MTMTTAREISNHVVALDRLADRLDPEREGHRTDLEKRTRNQRIAFEIDGALARLQKASELAKK